jgi:hypothetical protein
MLKWLSYIEREEWVITLFLWENITDLVLNFNLHIVFKINSKPILFYFN